MMIYSLVFLTQDHVMRLCYDHFVVLEEGVTGLLTYTTLSVLVMRID